MQICDKIAKLRKRKGLSQEELANLLEVSRQSVFKWECGENTPDLEKIKKIAKLFNVSFDVLLDDEKSIDEAQPVTVSQPKVNSAPVNNKIKFRKTFKSGIKLNAGVQADYEHGYSGKRKVKGYNYSISLSKHKDLIYKKRYTRIMIIQNDILVNFFIDEQNKVFGFFFDGAPQFVCPFENLASFTLSNSGPHTGFSRSPVVGVGIGDTTTVGVGSTLRAQTRAPLIYFLNISYFAEDGTLQTYNINFGCNRSYICYDGTAKYVNDLYAWEDVLSLATNKTLNEVCVLLNGIKESGKLIREQKLDFPILM